MLKKFIFDLVIRIGSAVLPVALVVLRKSPRLQAMTIEFLAEIPIFNRAKHLLESTVPSEIEIITEGRNSDWMHNFEANRIPNLTIVIAIFNAYEAVEECLTSVIGTIRANDEVLLIDDCSTDPRMPELLNKYATDSRIRIVRNEQNLGYTKSINRAFALTECRDVILLNSDTIVTPRWIENLTYLAYSDNRVATVTPMSDNAGAFSFPEVNVSNLLPVDESRVAFANKISRAGLGRRLDVPTGNGFCLFIKRSALEQIGLYDETKYPRGYGEENDFCMRAYRDGWLNLVSDKVYIFHKTSQSFGEEKQALLASGLRNLKIDYPEYEYLTQRYFDKEFLAVRNRQRNNWRKPEFSNPRVLFVMPIEGGGLPETNKDLTNGLAGKLTIFKAFARGKTFRLYQIFEDGSEVLIETTELLRPVDAVSHRSHEYDSYFADVLYRHSIDLVHIEHLAWQSTGLIAATKSLCIPIVASIHDYYAICPSHNLLDENNVKCRGKCTSTIGRCEVSLWPIHSLPPIKNEYISVWQSKMGAALRDIDILISPSNSAAQNVAEIYREAGSKIIVVPHGRDFRTFLQPKKHIRTKGKTKILFPGNINDAKGAELIRQVASSKISGELEFHFLGETHPKLKPFGVQHGPYSRDEFSQKVLEIDPDFGAIFSIWDETFCHTLTELWAAGLPVFGLNSGAVGERIAETGCGWLIDENNSPDEISRFIGEICKNHDEIAAKREDLERWQSGNPKFELIDMGNAYLEIYRSAGLKNA